MTTTPPRPPRRPRLVIPATRAHPDAIEADARTKPMPIVRAVRHAAVGDDVAAVPNGTEESTESDGGPADTSQPPTDAEPAIDEASAEDRASLVPAVRTAGDAEAPPEVKDEGHTLQVRSESTTAVLTGELVAGLRSASRHLARPSAYEGHLRTELTITARRLEALVRANHAHDAQWAIAAAALVHDAGAALEQRRITDGWQLLRAAQVELLEALDQRGLAVELAGLTGAPVEAVDIEDAERLPQLRAEVWALSQTRNVRRAELERRLNNAARGLFHRAVMLVGVIVLGAIGVLVSSPSDNNKDALGSITSYLTIFGLAMTGAAVSYSWFNNESKRASAVAEMGNPIHLILLRLCFGGVVGLLLVVLLQADIQNLINVTSISAYPWAIAGGFSERFVDKLVDKLEDDAHAAADEEARQPR